MAEESLKKCEQDSERISPINPKTNVERYWYSLGGYSADLECVIFKSDASCSFWNKADHERIK